jgi:hypothetical protein
LHPLSFIPFTARSSVFRTRRIKAGRFELGSILQQILDEQTDIWLVEDFEILCSQGGGYEKTVVCWYVTVLSLLLNLPTVYTTTSYITDLGPLPLYQDHVFPSPPLLVKAGTILYSLATTIQTTRCHIHEGHLYTSLARCCNIRCCYGYGVTVDGVWIDDWIYWTVTD